MSVRMAVAFEGSAVFKHRAYFFLAPALLASIRLEVGLDSMLDFPSELTL